MMLVTGIAALVAGIILIVDQQINLGIALMFGGAAAILIRTVNR